MLHRLPLLVLLLLAGTQVFVPALHAAPQEAAAEPEAPASDVARLPEGEASVDVHDVVDDAAIEARVREILVATERFPDATVRVRQGVVFLEGVCESDEHRRWAGTLAGRTEDVVAVFNDLTVRPAPIWDVSPALEVLRDLGRKSMGALPLLVLGLLVLGVAALFARLLSHWVGALVFRRSGNRILATALDKLVLGLVLVFGAYLFLRITDLTRAAAGLIGGTGLLGLILGLAFRDIGENLLASLLISIQRPFRIGDTVEIEGHQGIVHRVTMRGTILMDFDGNHIQIANATIYKATIKNFTANPKTRVGFSVGIGYDTDAGKAQAVALEVMRAHEAVLDDPEPVVLLSRLGAATVDLRVFCWIDGQAYSKLKVESSLMRRLVVAFLEAGVSMPDEAREVVFPGGVPVRMLHDEPAPAVVVPEPAPAEPAVAPAEPPLVVPEEDLGSEVAELKEQAQSSRAPEEGVDLLTTEP